MDDEPSVVYYDMAEQVLRLRLSGGEVLRLTGFTPDLSFRAGDGTGETRLPLWLSQPEAEVLGKMINFILQRQPITAESRELLVSLQPRVEELRDEMDLLQATDDAAVD